MKPPEQVERQPETGRAVGDDRKDSAGNRGESLPRLRVAVGIIATFVAAVAVVMVYGQWVQPREEPWRSESLTAAKARLLKEPKNESLKNEIRRQDQALRTAYFRGLERNRMGAWLLLASGVCLVWGARELGRLGVRRLSPAKTADPADRALHLKRTRATVAWTGGVLVVAFALSGMTTRSHLTRWEGANLNRPTAGAGEGTEAPTDAVRPSWASAARLAENWPRFLGSDGASRGASTNLPLRWDVASGDGVLWKAPIGLPGYNSPIVWDERVFLTGGDRSRRRVYCLEAGSGKVLWEAPVTPIQSAAPELEAPDQSGQAACSVATDGERVFAVFATGELGALDFDGSLKWHTRLDFTENSYGHASSLVVWQDRLLVQADRGYAEDGKSQLMAFNTRTGEVLWTAKRPVGGSWTTPVVTEVAGRWQVVTAGDPWLMAHDPATGGELWRAEVLGGELAPSPVVASNLVLTICPGVAMSAVRADGSGVVTSTHVVWKLEEDVPDVPTPVVVGDLFFTANTEGHVFCREVATGEAVWDHEFETEFQASPLWAGGRIYLMAQPGNVFVIEAGREFREVATFEMGDEIYASPGVAGDRLYVRTKSALYALGGGTGVGARKVADAD